MVLPVVSNVTTVVQSMPRIRPGRSLQISIRKGPHDSNPGYTCDWSTSNGNHNINCHVTAAQEMQVPSLEICPVAQAPMGCKMHTSMTQWLPDGHSPSKCLSLKPGHYRDRFLHNTPPSMFKSHLSQRWSSALKFLTRFLFIFQDISSFASQHWNCPSTALVD